MFNTNPNKMSVKFFNRHEVFTPELLDYHADTIQMIDKIRYVEDSYYESDSAKSEWKELYNYLNAIYDGVLYPDLQKTWYIDSAPFHTLNGDNNKERGQKIAMRIYTIIGIINCSKTSSQPMTAHQAMMAIAYKCKTRSGSVTI